MKNKNKIKQIEDDINLYITSSDTGKKVRKRSVTHETSIKCIYKIESFDEHDDLYFNSPDTWKPVFRLSVQKQFLYKYSKVRDFMLKDYSKIITKYKVLDYLHNPIGPALERIVHIWNKKDAGRYVEYRLNGKKLTKKEFERMNKK